MLRTLLACLSVLALRAQSPTPEKIRDAAARAVAVVQRGASGFYKSQDCFSCHHNALPLLAFAAAREHGVPVDQAVAAQVAGKGLRTSPDLSSIDRAVQDPTIIDPSVGEGWALIAAHAAGLEPNLATAAYARRIASWQRAEGYWPTGDGRPPQSSSYFTATAVAVRLMQLYMPARLGAEKDARIARAKAWLLSTPTVSTEDAAFRLLGLGWAGAAPAERSRAVRELLALERPDGGWAQLAHMQPEAYSTAEALVALNQAGGVAVTAPEYRKGLRYLLSTQDDSGAWHVRTRMVSPAPVSPPYMETGFPYGHDQFVSTAGTCWAVIALTAALPRVNRPRPPAPPELAAKGAQPWMETALFGTAAELKSLLDGGLDPNSHTPDGTTALMMSAPDAGKAKLLIERGADVRAKAKTGFTALMVAATQPGTAASVKLLLAHGAEAKGTTGVLFNASPLPIAAMASDRDVVSLLLAAGADPNRRMIVLGMFPSSPLFAAVAFGDPGTLTALVKGGADIREKDKDGMTALHWAVLANRPLAVKTLLALGAPVDAVDRFGYTPLLYASTVDFGDAGTALALLSGGANPALKNPAGHTAMAQARDYPQIRAALEKAGAR